MGEVMLLLLKIFFLLVRERFIYRFCITPWLRIICVRFLHSLERFFDQAVGIQTGKIKNAAFTASSQWDRFHAPFRARLHIQKQGRYIGAWASRANNHNQWLMVDLGIPTKVTGIATQGRQDAAQWVTAFWVYYSLDGMHFSRVTYWWDYIRVSVLGLFKHSDWTCHPVTPRCTCQRFGFFTVWVECTSLTFYLPHNNDKLLVTVSWIYCSLEGVYLSGVVYVRVNF